MIIDKTNIEITEIITIVLLAFDNLSFGFEISDTKSRIKVIKFDMSLII
jgi:hypothetical protein